MNLTMLMKFGEHITENTPIGEKISFGLQVVGIGMGVVFGVLVLLIGILQLFKLFSVKQPKESPVKSVAPVASAPVAASVPASDEEKLVAVATAAIAASRGKSDVDFRVLSFAPVGTAVNTVVAAPAPVAAPAGATAIKAPMPGTILDVKVSVGSTVSEGQVVAVLEAMKMENDICTPVAGKVVAVNIKKGDTVNSDDLLVSIQ